MAKNILDFLQRLHAMQARAAQLSSKEVIVGWANGAREQPRTISKGTAIAINDRNVGKNGRRKKRPEFVSNFDENFSGPGIQAASLAAIAKTLCYGREGGISSKDGHEYGRIPARNFVLVMKDKHWRPLNRAVASKVVDLENPSPDIDMNFIGVVAKGQLQRAMRDSNEYAPNSAFTKSGGWMKNPVNGKPFHAEPKGSERPLINSGTLINSVDFEIKGR